MYARATTTTRLVLGVALALGLSACGPLYDDVYEDAPYQQQTEPAYEPEGTPEASMQDFHQSLDAHGRWVDTPEYGTVWIPHAAQQAGWRPYAYGHWAYTDYGWTWVSDEAWGWAPYHYGRWTWYASHGWVWVPGTTWAPAWVVWRWGGGYAGWAPMPPGWVVGAYWYGGYYGSPTYWSFCHTSYLTSASVHTVIVTGSAAQSHMQSTQVVDNVRRSGGPNGGYYNAGPVKTDVERATGRRIDTAHVGSLPRATPPGRAWAATSRPASQPDASWRSGSHTPAQRATPARPSASGGGTWGGRGWGSPQRQAPAYRASPTETYRQSPAPTQRSYTPTPTAPRSYAPSSTPSYRPSSAPSYRPSSAPSYRPSSTPSYRPSSTPSYRPSSTPSYRPSSTPSYRPSSSGSSRPSGGGGGRGGRR